MSDPTAAPSLTFKYRAFISYSHADKSWGDWLHAALETYRVPRKLVGMQTREGVVPARLYPIFRDREELPTSSDLGGNIREALAQSHFLVVICSPRSAQSYWVNEEILTFKRLGRENHILPLIIDGEPGAGEGKSDHPPEAECFPPALRYALGAGGTLSTVRTEPIAADARPGRDGRNNAKLKLLAGLLGVDYDALRQRERERQRRRRLTSALVVLALIGAFLAFWCIQQSGAERRLAAQRLAAERDRQARAAHQAAVEAEEDGRRELLAGHATAAVDRLKKALASESGHPAARLMLGVAERESAGTAAVLEHQEETVQTLDLSPEGTHLLVIGIDGRVGALWDMATHLLVCKIPLSGNEFLPGGHFNGHGDKLLLPGRKGWRIHDVTTGHETDLPQEVDSHACFLGDGQQVLWFKNSSVGDTVSFAIFDSNTGSKLREFTLGAGLVGGLQSDRTGRTILAGWFAPAPPPDGAKFWVGEPRLKWFEVDTGRIIADLPRHESGHLEPNPNGERLLYLRADNAFEVRSPEAMLWETRPTRDVTAAGHWSRGGKYVLISGRGKTVIFDGETGKPLWGGNFTEPTTDAADSLLAYADLNGTVHVHDLASGRILAAFSDQIGWPDRSLFPTDRLASFTPDARFLILAGSGHSVKIWDWRRAAAEPMTLGEPGKAAAASAVTFSPDGRRLAELQTDGRILVWNTQTGQQQTALATGGEAGGVWTMGFNADGSQLLTGIEKPSGLFTAQLWNVASGESIDRLDDGATANSADGSTSTRSPMLEQHIRAAWAGNRLITVNFNLGIGCLWDAATRVKLQEFKVGARSMELAPSGGETHPRLIVSANSQRFIVAGFDDSARVFDTRDAKLVATLMHPFPHLDRAELNADGAIALTADAGGHFAVWDVSKSRNLSMPDSDSAEINEVHLAACGRYVVAACSDKSVRVWDTASGKFLPPFHEEKPAGEGVKTLGAPLDLTIGGTPATGFLSVQCDPQGLWVAGINDDGLVCAWELPSGRQLLRWKLDPPSRQARLTVSPDGHLLAVTGLDGATRIFHLTEPNGEIAGALNPNRESRR